MQSSSTTKGVSSLAPLTTKALLNDLRHSLEEETRNATFACGGNILISQELVQQLVGDQRAYIKPVTIRFGPSGTGQTLILPTNDVGDPAFQQLVKSCEPATFGRGGQDVYDEGYRKATKLDTADFCTDFCPYDAGIVDIVTQLLVPGAVYNGLPGEPKLSEAQKAREVQLTKNRGLRAESYKLNVYSGPSGMFKAHVDTPRSEKQIASLVIALPTLFTGTESQSMHCFWVS